MGSSPTAPAKIKGEDFSSPLIFCRSSDFCVGLEGRVLNDSPGDCQIAPPLRPQSGKSYCPCQKKDDCESNRLFSVIFAACATSYMHLRCVILPYGSDIALRAVEKANIISLLR